MTSREVNRRSSCEALREPYFDVSEFLNCVSVSPPTNSAGNIMLLYGKQSAWGSEGTTSSKGFFSTMYVSFESDILPALPLGSFSFLLRHKIRRLCGRQVVNSKLFCIKTQHAFSHLHTAVMVHFATTLKLLACRTSTLHVMYWRIAAHFKARDCINCTFLQRCARGARAGKGIGHNPSLHCSVPFLQQMAISHMKTKENVHRVLQL